MARDRREIKKTMTDAFIADPVIIEKYGLTPGNTFEQEFSLVSLENILFNIVSFFIFIHEQIVSENAANSRPQNLRNFIATILNFHDGLPLVWIDGRFQYDLTGIADPDALKVVSRCAVLETADGELVVKVAGNNNGELEPLPVDVANRLDDYITQVKVPGVNVNLINQQPDLLKLTLRVYIDTLMIDETTGQQLNVADTVYPVKDAIKEYLNALEFNGAFVTDFFKSTIIAKPGINLVGVDLLQWSFNGVDFIDFEEWKVPDSGYFKVNDVDLTILYLPYVLVNN